ncbi:MAG: DNA replication and repair protein RecF, partial [Clostridia bacterium]|nr:DNA replication and repair protein RecF [Clostridia bacterium]
SFFAEGIKHDAALEIKEKKTAFLNDNRLKTAAALAGTFHAVVFSPNDLSLIKDGPAVRRRFLDLAIGQLFPSYIPLLREYLRAVTQRNQLLKSYQYDPSLSVMLEVFEREIAEKGRKIIAFRKKYVAAINTFLPVFYEELSSGKERLDMQYHCVLEEPFEETLEKSRKKDMFTGSTSVGPHRDDLLFTINGTDARAFGSQGQKRSVALAVRLAEAHVVERQTGEMPVFLLDDVMSELDPGRQQYILNHIKGIQSFLTCCDPSDTAGLKDGKIFYVENGSVV